MDRLPIAEEDSLARRIVSEGIASEAVLGEALRSRPAGQPLGVFLVIKGILAADQLERLLFPATRVGGDRRATANHTDLLLADALLEKRIVPPREVEAALSVQKDLPLPLGTLLVRMGSVSATRIREQVQGLPPVLPESAEPSVWSEEIVAAVRDAKRRFGKYVLMEEVGRGGMGVVYRAYDALLDRQVALKMLLTEAVAVGAPPTPLTGGTRETAVERFLREARAAGKLSHPGIIPVYEVGTQGGVHFFTMEFVEGPSLEKVLRGGRISPRAAAKVVQEAAEAVQHSHQAGIIHRDLKPGNVLLSTDPGSLAADATVATRMVAAPVVLHEVPGRVRIADFGLARSVAAPGLTSRGDVMGTPAYMAPEQAAGRIDDVDATSDVYSLGALLYHAMTGLPPYLGEGPMQILSQVLTSDPAPPRRHVPDLPMDLEVIALRAMSKEKERRYASAQDLADDLGRFLRGEPIHARPISRIERMSRWVRRHRPFAASLLALAVVLPLAAWAALRAHEKGIEIDLEHQAQQRSAGFEARGAALLGEADEEFRQPEADFTLYQKKLQEALKAFDSALHEYPKATNAQYCRGLVREYLIDLSGAMDDFDAVIEESPNFVPARLARAELRMSYLLYDSDPVLGSTPHPERWKKGGGFIPTTVAQEAVVTRIREDLEQVARIEPDREKSRCTAYLLQMLDGKPQEAIAGLDKEITSNKNFVWAYFLRARCLAACGRFEDALKDVDRFLLTAPNALDPLLLKGVLLLRLNRREEALKALERAAPNQSLQGPKAEYVARYLIKQGFFDAALAEIDAHPDESRTPWRMVLAGAIHVHRGEWSAAVAAAEEGLRAPSTQASSLHYLKGIALSNLQDSAGAIAEMKEAMSENTGLPTWWIRSSLSFVYLETGRLRESLDEIDEALIGMPLSTALLVQRSAVLLALQRAPEAAADAKHAVAMDPSDSDAHEQLGSALLAQGRRDEALAETDKAIELQPDDPVHHEKRALCLARMGRRIDAFEELDKMVTLARNDPSFLCVRAKARLEVGKIADAIADLDEALAKEPNLRTALWLRAQARWELSKYEEALADDTKYLDLDPTNREVRGHRGYCLENLHGWAEARKEFERLAREDPSDADSWYHLGVCAFSMKDRYAIECFRKAEGLFPEGEKREGARKNAEAADRKLPK